MRNEKGHRPDLLFVFYEPDRLADDSQIAHVNPVHNQHGADQ